MSLKSLEIENFHVRKPEIVENVEVYWCQVWPVIPSKWLRSVLKGKCLSKTEKIFLNSDNLTPLGVLANQEAWISPLYIKIGVECDAEILVRDFRNIFDVNSNCYKCWSWNLLGFTRCLNNLVKRILKPFVVGRSYF